MPRERQSHLIANNSWGEARAVARAARCVDHGTPAKDIDSDRAEPETRSEVGVGVAAISLKADLGNEVASGAPREHSWPDAWSRREPR